MIEVEFCHVINDKCVVTVDNVQKVTQERELMSRLKEAIKSGNFDDEQLRAYLTQDIQNELYITDGIVCRGKKVIIPSTLQHDVVALCHEGNQGETKAKALPRRFCWFPCIDKLLD